MPTTPKEKKEKLTLSIGANLRRKVLHLADIDGRSLSNYVCRVLAAHVEEKEG